MFLLLSSLATATDAAPPPAPYPGATVLFTDGFDRDALEPWAVQTASWSGRGPRSKAATADGALYLHVRYGDRRFAAATRAVETGGARLVRVTARVRGEGLDFESARISTCQLTMSTPTAFPTPIAACPTDGAWAMVDTAFVLPEDTHELTIGAYSTVPGRAWFDDVRVEAVQEIPWVETRDGPFTFHSLPHRAPSPSDLEAFRIAHAALVALFGVPADGPIEWWSYPTVALKAYATGNSLGSHVEGNAVHDTGESAAYLLAYVLGAPLGDPPELLSLGVGAYVVRQMPARFDPPPAPVPPSPWRPLATLLDDATGWTASDVEAAHAEGACFVEWLVATRGREAVVELYGALRRDADGAENVLAIERILGLPIATVDARVASFAAAR